MAELFALLQGSQRDEIANIARRSDRSWCECQRLQGPEILTNSISIFQGVEVAAPLYPLLDAFKKEHPIIPGPGGSFWRTVRSLVKPEPTLAELIAITDSYLRFGTSQAGRLRQWRPHNAPGADGVDARHVTAIIRHEQGLAESILTAALSENRVQAAANAMLTRRT